LARAQRAGTFALVRSIALALLVLTSACGGAAKPTETKTAAKHEKKPKCPAGSDDMPKDARGKMAEMQAAVRKCYSLGIGGGDADVKVEVTVGESGEVRDTKVMGASGHPTAVECLKKTLHSAKFAKFCGPDVSISWTYALR
jgi:hypothetical protein